jgi:hypothetical protein
MCAVLCMGSMHVVSKEQLSEAQRPRIKRKIHATGVSKQLSIQPVARPILETLSCCPSRSLVTRNSATAHAAAICPDAR